MKPYRIAVFASGTVTKGKGKKQRTEKRGYAYMGWNPDHTAVRRAALDHLLLPETEQVSVRTNQDREVFRFFRSNLDRHLGQMRLPLAA